MEELLTSEGRTTDADGLFIAQKVRERQEQFWPVSKLKWLYSMVFACTIGYGRKLQWAFGWSALVVLFGSIVFRSRNGMVRKDCESHGRKYNPLWFSLDIFAPVINLEAASVWEPRHDRRFAWIVLRFERILGWLLVPLIIAVLGGIVK
jgi:hypothetical protein